MKKDGIEKKKKYSTLSRQFNSKMYFRFTLGISFIDDCVGRQEAHTPHFPFIGRISFIIPKASY